MPDDKKPKLGTDPDARAWNPDEVVRLLQAVRGVLDDPTTDDALDRLIDTGHPGQETAEQVWDELTAAYRRCSVAMIQTQQDSAPGTIDLDDVCATYPPTEDFCLRDDGTLDTVVSGPGGYEGRFSQEAADEYRTVGCFYPDDWAAFVSDIVRPSWWEWDADQPPVDVPTGTLFRENQQCPPGVALTRSRKNYDDGDTWEGELEGTPGLVAATLHLWGATARREVPRPWGWAWEDVVDYAEHGHDLMPTPDLSEEE